MADAAKATGGPSAEERKALNRRFQAQEAEVRLVNYRRGALLAIIFAMSGGILDALAYDEYLTDFFLLRVGACLLIGGILALLYVPRLRPAARFLGHLVALVPMLALHWMLVRIDDSASPYYAGLNLNMVGAVLILRWRTSDGVINALLCIGGYLAVSVGLQHNPSDVIVATFFLFVTAVFACGGLYFYNQLRFKEFCLREEVVAQQEELAENHRKLQKLDETKTRFFANISHELRTPLTLILAPVEKIRASNAVRHDPALATLVDSLEDNGMRLLRLINDLLDLVRLDSGDMPMRPERFLPAIFIEGLGRNLQPMAERKRINLTWTTRCAEGREVYLDRDRLEKVVLNLAVNALKFTPPSGRVALLVGIVGDKLRLEVTDTGAGMAPEQLDSAFERFWQADTSARKKHRGVGIGLALVKSLTESMGGTVEIKSELGRGTTVLIEVPLAALPEGEPAGPREELSGVEEDDAIAQIHERARLHAAIGPLETVLTPFGLAGAGPLPSGNLPRRERVLVAEDERGMRQFLRAELNELDCDVIEACDGEEAWELARQFQPELIVLDYMMPERDGISLTRELRAHHSTSQVPILLLTAAADETPRLEALEAGVSDFLTKPFSTAELRLRIRNLLDRQKYQRELGSKNQALNAALEEIKDNEARLLQAEKLSSLGRMSAGIVHEVNNPLNYAKTALHTLRVYSENIPPEEREDFDETIHDAEDGVNRVIRIVSDLRSFTKGEATVHEEVRIAETIEMARRLLSGDLEGIDFKVEVPDDLRVLGNSNQLCQVFVNLIQNSAQALEEAPPGAGKPIVTIRSEPAPDGRVMLLLHDNGPGIAPEDLDHVFDPFFTKREVGEGMGLGLSICHRILESHQGRIEVKSVPGEFTEFRIVLRRPWDEESDEVREDPNPRAVQLEGAQVK